MPATGVVADDRGQHVTLRQPIERIVSLLPSHTETLFALGLGDRLVGVDEFSDFPPATRTLPKLGNAFGVSVERVVALRPDLVLAAETSPALPALSAAGVPVWAGSVHQFEAAFALVERLGALTGRTQAGRELAARMRADVAQVAARMAGRPQVRVYYELDPAPYSVGPASFIGMLLQQAGGRTIVPAGLGDFPKISPELVVRTDPEVILGVTLEEARRRPGWQAIAAVRAGRVWPLTPGEVALVDRGGPRMAEGVTWLARKLHPEVAW
jgi:iron complex transport system substrate-binding protein